MRHYNPVLHGSRTAWADQERRFKGGGGGSSGPTQTNVQNTNIPEYAQPYVETMLGTAQQQVYNMSGDTVTGFKPYQPYSTNPSDYIAPFSPLQNRSFTETAALTTPTQFASGTAMTGAGGLGALGAGADYMRMATSPAATKAFMNPYLSAALDPQLAEISRQYGITGTDIAGKATAAGAFGGSREALMAAENQRNKNMAMNLAIGQGYDKAFQAAQQAQQYGANLGLQGYGQAAQAGAQLGQLGTAERAAQEANINLRNQMGLQQQTQQQNILNQAIQNYATAQQYPMQQLASMSALLRGLPLQATTTETYQAQPTALSTVAGLGTGIAGAAKLLGNKGGLPKDFQIKKMAGGGVTSLANRQRLAEKLSPKQLDIVVANKTIPQEMGNELRQDSANMQERMAQAAALTAQRQEDRQAAELAAKQAAIEAAGIDQAPTNLPTQGMAQGGIVAFAGKEGSLVEEPTSSWWQRQISGPVSEYGERQGKLSDLRVQRQRLSMGLGWGPGVNIFTQETEPQRQARLLQIADIDKQIAALSGTPTPPATQTATPAYPVSTQQNVVTDKGPVADTTKEGTDKGYNISAGSTAGFLSDVNKAYAEGRKTLEEAKGYEGRYAPQLKRAIGEQEKEAYAPTMTRAEAEAQAGKLYEGTPYAELEKSIRGRMAGYEKEKDQAIGYGLLAMSEQLLSNARFSEGLGKGLGAFGSKYGAEIKEIKAAQRQDEKGLADIEQAKRLEQQGKYKEADRLYERGQDKQQAARNTLTGTLSSINAQDVSKAAQFATAEAGLSADQAKAAANIGIEGMKLQQSAAQASAHLRLLDKHYAAQDKATQMQYLKIRSAAANNVSKDPGYQADLRRLAIKYKDRGGVDSEGYKYDAEALRMKYLDDHMGNLLDTQSLGVRSFEDLANPTGQ